VGDSGDNQMLIRTVARKELRFVVEVRVQSKSA
jgi:DNA-binding winged helix-turn-helix (wHTH) protein